MNKFEEDSDTTCPKCGKDATVRVIKRDGQCSRCTAEDMAEQQSAHHFAALIISSDIRYGGLVGLPDREDGIKVYVSTVWKLARALAAQGRSK